MRRVGLGPNSGQRPTKKIGITPGLPRLHKPCCCELAYFQIGPLAPRAGRRPPPHSTLKPCHRSPLEVSSCLGRQLAPSTRFQPNNSDSALLVAQRPACDHGLRWKTTAA